MHEKTAAVLVTAASAPLALSGDAYQALLSVALGLSGVGLARAVFINRERRSTGLKPKTSDTLPLTMVAMLITGVVIWDRGFGLSLSVFTGLGVGWTAILLLDIIGEWMLKTGRRVAGLTDKEAGIPADQSELLNQMRGPKEQDHSYDEEPEKVE